MRHPLVSRTLCARLKTPPPPSTPPPLCSVSEGMRGQMVKGLEASKKCVCPPFPPPSPHLYPSSPPPHPFRPFAILYPRAAAGVGNVEMLRFLFEEACPWDRRTCAAAARSSNLEVLAWLRAKGCPWDARTLDAAAEVGAMDVFEWATSNGCPS